MGTLTIILIILGTAAAVWQLALIAFGVIMIAGGQHKSVTVGCLPGIVAIALFIAAVLA